jgi:hypothetical protein
MGYFSFTWFTFNELARSDVPSYFLDRICDILDGDYLSENIRIVIGFDE